MTAPRSEEHTSELQSRRDLHSFPTRRSSGLVRVNWTQSMIDCYVWYYEKYLRLAGINGTWWDDGALGTLTDWDARRDKFVTQWWFLARRQLTKRLNVIG